MKRSFDDFVTKKWKNVYTVVVDRDHVGQYQVCSYWLDRYDSNGEYHESNSFYSDHNTLLRIYSFTDEADAMMFKLTFGGQ